MITYRSPYPDTLPSYKIPVLHKVVYAHTIDGVMAAFQRSFKDHLVDEWLRSNCKCNYYHSPGYLQEKFIQFEDDYEAVIFALRWSDK